MNNSKNIIKAKQTYELLKESNMLFELFSEYEGFWAVDKKDFMEIHANIESLINTFEKNK